MSPPDLMLTVHPDNSKFIIFHPRRKHAQINPLILNILINNTLIARVQEHKFLGIVIDENLSWKAHITSICDKVAKVIGIFSKSRRCLPLVILKTLYNSLFLPYFNDCNLIWAFTYTSYLEPLFLLQKKALNYQLFFCTF